jgi:riboflavin kinase
MVARDLSPALLLSLYKLAELGAFPGEIVITTTRLAESLNVSQQTASRHLIELESMGFVTRARIDRGEAIRVTARGSEELKKMHLRLKTIFEMKPREVLLEGTLFSGIGEGAWYVTRTGYRTQFKDKLGFDPFPGTLNLRVKRGYDDERKLLETFPAVHIEGFRNGERSFGSVVCYRAKINETEDGALISAVRTHYSTDVIELIAPGNLRERLRLKDGDMVRVRVVSQPPEGTSA